MNCCHRPSNLLSLTFILTAVTLAGCGGGPGYEGPQRSALTGTVTVDGSPLAGGTIAFVSSDDADRSTSAPIADGMYSIPEGKGPTYGEFHVVISGNLASDETLESDEESPAGEDDGVETGDDDVEEEEEEESGGRFDEFVSPDNTLPAKYNFETELSAEVNSASHVFNFDLKTN